ncbi:hypothetical protein B0A55_10428 [Friedmanniomyces simplex]|uniref:Uncharacterized protein n=1 Tax=Friedmanniomyces simplex TaxID=329884 RepID=A0A4U0WJI2_9PEZI|nr:hypothetical protein B0A55_10428 [Friedmanniomyces simplex]
MSTATTAGPSPTTTTLAISPGISTGKVLVISMGIGVVFGVSAFVLGWRIFRGIRRQTASRAPKSHVAAEANAESDVPAVPTVPEAPKSRVTAEANIKSDTPALAIPLIVLRTPSTATDTSVIVAAKRADERYNGRYCTAGLTVPMTAKIAQDAARGGRVGVGPETPRLEAMAKVLSDVPVLILDGSSLEPAE